MLFNAVNRWFVIFLRLILNFSDRLLPNVTTNSRDYLH